MTVFSGMELSLMYDILQVYLRGLSHQSELVVVIRFKLFIAKYQSGGKFVIFVLMGQNHKIQP
jgi:hypothetical protein